MTIVVTSGPTDDSSGHWVCSRYVKYDGFGVYRWCEVGEDRRFDLRQGTCAVDDLPLDVAAAAIERRHKGVWPFYVDWPLA